MESIAYIHFCFLILLSLIGLPPVADSDLGHVNARSPMDLWKQAFTSFFPQQVSL